MYIFFAFFFFHRSFCLKIKNIKILFLEIFFYIHTQFLCVYVKLCRQFINIKHKNIKEYIYIYI